MRSTVLLAVLLLLASCAPPTSVPTNVAEVRSLPWWEARDAYAANLILQAQDVLDALPGATVYDVQITVDGSLTKVRGRQRVRYTNREQVALDHVYFRLFPNVNGGEISISSLTVADRTVEPILEYADSALRVPLGLPLAPQDQVTIEMDFDVQLPTEMGGNYGLFGYLSGVLVLDEFCPAIPVYDDQGWNVQVPPPNADLSFFDVAFYSVRVTAPAELVVVASGVQVSREERDGNQVLLIVAGPIRDFYLAASPAYTVMNRTVGETQVNSYSSPDARNAAQVALEVAVNALQSFGQRLGTYPYAELDLVATPMQALGMEYPGVAAISNQLYDAGSATAGTSPRAYLESSVAHEVAHQWFYNAVASDQVDEPWLDEALAQYLTGLYFLDTYGPEAFESYRASWIERWARVDRADIPIGLPADAYEGREYGAIVYGRGPLFVHALAQEMGQETFDAFLRRYYQFNLWEIGTENEFQSLAEEECQCELDALFDAWVYPD